MSVNPQVVAPLQPWAEISELFGVMAMSMRDTLEFSSAGL